MGRIVALCMLLVAAISCATTPRNPLSGTFTQKFIMRGELHLVREGTYFAGLQNQYIEGATLSCDNGDCQLGIGLSSVYETEYLIFHVVSVMPTETRYRYYMNVEGFDPSGRGVNLATAITAYQDGSIESMSIIFGLIQTFDVLGNPALLSLKATSIPLNPCLSDWEAFEEERSFVQTRYKNTIKAMEDYFVALAKSADVVVVPIDPFVGAKHSAQLELESGIKHAYLYFTKQPECMLTSIGAEK